MKKKLQSVKITCILFIFLLLRLTPDIADPISTEVGDINLDNYYLDHQFYNTYVYVHKKFKPKTEINDKTCDVQTSVDNVHQDVEHKSQQCNMEVNRTHFNEKRKIRTSLHDDSMIEQTVKFAKDIIPKIIPPSREFSPTPVYYTIQTSKKSGKKIGKLSSSYNGYDREKKDKAKCFVKQTRMESKDDANNTESGSHSSHNSTLDEVQTNHSSTFSLSEGSENHQNKIVHNQKKRKHNNKENFIISEAIGTDSPDRSRIKVSIMNETERNIFCESLKVPIIDSVKEYLNQIQNSTDILSCLQHLSQAMAYNSQKLDFLVQKLDKIEKYVTDYSDKTTKIIMSPKPILSKASKLEELAEDLDEIKEESSVDEDDYHEKNARSVMTSQSAVVTTNRRKEYLGRGDDVPIHINATSTDFGIKSDRPNRIPARFCWTDTTENS